MREKLGIYTLALDPSGNFTEGKGTTGWVFGVDSYVISAGQIYAAECQSQMDYWRKIIELIGSYHQRNSKHEFHVVIEDYRLYASASEAQINSNLETPQLIGAIKFFCYVNEIPFHMQMAAEVKVRWSDEVLKNTGLIQDSGRVKTIGKVELQHHSMDALRHFLHFTTFKLKIQREDKDNGHYELKYGYSRPSYNGRRNYSSY